MLSIIGFLLTIGILVVVHEFGHYVVARIFKVKIICFSIGFGPKLLKWKSKHNEWCISAIPLGGYVQMLDEQDNVVPSELKAQAYNNKPPYQKLLIAFAGPFFNILFAFLAYYVMGIYGVYTLKPVIQTITPTPLVQNLNQIPLNSTIVSINNNSVTSWSSANKIFYNQVEQNPIVNITVKTSSTVKDKIIQLDLKKYLDNNETPDLGDLGVYPFKYLPIISYVEPQSPAAKAGLLEQDKIVKINQNNVKSWFDIAQIIRAAPSDKLNFEINRGNNLKHISLIADSSTDDNGQIIGKVGIMPTLDAELLMQNSYIKNYSVFSSFNYAYSSCLNLIQTNLTMLSYMVQGKLSWHNLGGPISVAKASQAALHQGVKAFIDLLALISLSLAIMNLLPIPVLDGGHIVIYTIECITGKKLSSASQQILFKIGLIAVLAISGIALYNDFIKLFNL